MNEKEKIKEYLEFKGIAKNKFYTTTGFSVGFLDSGTSIGADKIKTIIDNYPDLNLKWLVLDEGDMIINNPNTTNENQENKLELLLNLIKTKEELIKLQKERIVELENKLKKIEDDLINE